MTTPLVQRLTKTADIAGACDADDIAALLREAAEALAGRGEPVGPMDLSAPPKVWLQIDTNGDPDDRREEIPEANWGDLTWCHESIGGQEVVYIRQDLATPSRAGGGEVGEEFIDRALFSQADGDTAMLIDLMGMGHSDRLNEARRIMRAAMIAAFKGPPAAEGVDKDGERYRWLRDSKNCSLTINHNDHHVVYRTVEQAFEDYGGDPKSDYYGDVPDDERAKMIATDTIWTLHIYPNTPVGFNVYHAATLDAAIDAALHGAGARGGENG